MKENTMKIRVDFTWSRGPYNQDLTAQFVILKNVAKSKKGVTQAIRDYAKDWSGKGSLFVSDITAIFLDDQKHCEIAQRKFNFSN